MNKYQRAFVPTLIFFFTIMLVLFIRQLDSADRTSLHRKIMVFDLPDSWKDAKPHQSGVKSSRKQLLFNGINKVTKDTLGRDSWELLHMISGTMPLNFSQEFQARTNLFLNLFAQFYPSKTCSDNFLGYLRSNPFKGTTKHEFMQYLCDLHNLLNRQLNKPNYDCSHISEEWASCGCASSD